jgi:predicted nucleic acid-binding protein
MIVLDTSVLIDLFRGSETARSYLTSDSVTTVITSYEILAGIKHRNAKSEERLFRRFFSDVPLLEMNRDASENAAYIMGSLLAIGTPVNALDVLIVGIAMAYGADKIVSRDKDFLRIGKLASIDVLVY